MSKSKRVCELCNAVIPAEWDNEHHYGTCPSCKRGSNFIINNKELQEIADDENERKKKQFLLTKYNVLDINERSGMTHVNCVGMAKLVYNECGLFFKTIEDEGTGKQEIYYYRDGYYHPGGENKIRKVVDEFLDNYSSIHRKNEVVDYIKNRNIVKRESLEPPVHLINLKNGIYNLEKNKLTKHDPEMFFLNQIPVEYHEDAKCPRAKKFIEDVVYKEYVQVVQEIAGYLLYREYKYHKAFLFYGGGRNGKSTLMLLFRKLLGHMNYTNNSLDDILTNRFATASLYGKLANMGGEVSSKSLTDTSQFKRLTGNDMIRAEKKFYGSFSFRNYAKLIFNANHIPYSKYDKSLAYFQRWIIIVFPQTFPAEDKNTDPNIGNKITTKEELEGFLLWAIEGLLRLLKNNMFSYNDDADEQEVGERYMMLAKPEMRFIKDHLKFDEGNTVVADDVYEKYFKWADERNYPREVKKVFTSAMKRYISDKERGIICESKSTTINGKSTRIYTNVSWKKQPTESLRLDSFDSGEHLGDRLEYAKKIINKNIDAGFGITMDWLKNNFDDDFIKNMIDKNLLIKKPDDTYAFQG